MSSSGFGLVKYAVQGLMAHALNADNEGRIVAVLRGFVAEHDGGELEFHSLQTRESGRERFVSIHVLVPGQWSVTRGHDLVERVEESICSVLPGAQIHTHLEPREDPRSYEDMGGGHTGIDSREG